MSSTPPVQQKGMGGMPKWDEGDKRRAMKLTLYGVVLLTIAAWVVIIYWIVTYPDSALTKALKSTGADMTAILAPVLAAAAGVERSLETFFNILENSFKTMVAYLGKGLRWLKNTEIEVKQARQWLSDVSARYAQEMNAIQIAGQGSITTLTEEAQAKMAAANNMLALATQRLQAAEDNLTSATDSDGYRAAKAAASIILGLMLGVIVAQLASLQMFALMGVNVVPIKVDIFITGLVIGSGSYPVHSLVGILQSGKDALSSVQGFLNAKSASAAPAPANPVPVAPAQTQPKG